MRPTPPAPQTDSGEPEITHHAPAVRRLTRQRRSEAVRRLRKAIFEDVRGHFEQWPEYLFEFVGLLTEREVEAELQRAIGRLKVPEKSPD